MSEKTLQIYGKQAVFHTTGNLCAQAKDLVASGFFLDFLDRYLDYRRAGAHPVLEQMDQPGPSALTVGQWQSLFAGLCEQPLEEVALRLPHAVDLLAPRRRKALMEFVNGFYDFWRSYGRYMVIHSAPAGEAGNAFDGAIEGFTHLIRDIYRDICRNISGRHPRVYRQVPAGCNAALIAAPKASPMPQGMREVLGGIPFVRQTWIVPPMILDPPSNTRTGSFQPAGRNPVLGLRLDPPGMAVRPRPGGPDGGLHLLPPAVRGPGLRPGQPV